MLTLIFVPIAYALFLYIVDDERFNRLGPGLLVLELLLVLRLFDQVLSEGTLRLALGGYATHVGIELLADPLMVAFALLGVCLWFFSSLYAMTKWSGDNKFFFFFHFLRGSYYAFLFSNDLFNIFVLVELISLISAVLITYKKDGFAVRAGFYYLLFNSVGMVFYLLGIMVVYQKVGSLNIDHMRMIPEGTSLQFALSMMVVAFGVKSAFFPVYNWLPKAHAAAPTSISMLLSGLLVKSGFVGLIKIFRVLGDRGFSDYLLVIGILTATVGFLFAVSQKDIKMTLAFSTVSQSGLILVGIASGGVFPLGGLLHLVNHALFKGTLFLIAGILISAYKTRRTEEIRGVFQTMPGIGLVLVVAILSITAFPWTNGYISKSLIAKGDLPTWIQMTLHMINTGTLVYFLKIASVFRKERHPRGKLSVPLEKRLAVYGLGILLVLSAVFEPLLLSQYAGVTVKVGLSSFLTFGLYLGFALLVYRLFLYREHPLFHRLRHFRLGFADANLLMMVFIITAVWWTL